MKIAVIGTGYVGLVAGACFADSGNTVICLDHDAKKIDALKKGEIPIYEPGLEEIVRRGVEEERLTFTTSFDAALPVDVEIVFMAVSTPQGPTGEADLSYLKKAAQDVGKAMKGPLVIVNKSTVPIGSHVKVSEWIAEFSKFPAEVVSNPEFLKEGSAIEDFMKPDRVVIGTRKKEVYEKMAELYAPFVRQGNPILWMDPVSAEVTKYACNSFLATRISFMNELAILSEQVGADIELIRKGMATDVRIGKHFLYAGVGYGGSCFPKDVQALLATARAEKVPMGIIDAAEAANARQKEHLVKLVKKHFNGEISGRTFGVVGLAFKPNTDDIREAPALIIMQGLLAAGAKVKAFDPVAMPNVQKTFKESGVTYCESIYETVSGTDGMLLVTEWNEFRNPDFKKIHASMKTPVIFDGRNIYAADALKKLGFQYYGIGRS
ncbi:MAG: UDP-glucose/GDP-mannose dehydrogenase family protein [Bacteriovoracia bacterium]